MPRNLKGQTVTSTEFGRAVGMFIEKSAKAPVFITKHARTARVLLDYEEYERLKSRDTRRTFPSAELSDEHRKMIKDAEYGPVDAELEKLMD